MNMSMAQFDLTQALPRTRAAGADLLLDLFFDLRGSLRLRCP